jgi:hypothetical protein
MDLDGCLLYKVCANDADGQQNVFETFPDKFYM